MKSLQRNLLFVACLWTLAHAFGGTEEKFIKKYAMMKVYESCFGPQVLKEIRREMREAAQKCSDFIPQSEDKYSNKDGNNFKSTTPGNWLNQELTHKTKPTTSSKTKKPTIHTADTLLLQKWTEEQNKQHNSNTDGSTSEEHSQSENDNNGAVAELESAPSSKKPVDISKLEEAILNIGRPSGSNAIQKHTASSSSSAGIKFHQPSPLGYYPPMYYPPPMPFPPSYPYHGYYPGYFQSPAPMGGPAFQSLYRHGIRSAKITNFNSRKPRENEFKVQIDSTAFQFNTKFRNISCIMQELGYLDGRLEPNFSKINERINKLNVEEELKKDMLDGVRFCKQFSQCIPDTRHNTQFSRELLKPMFFFRCYKHKKLESCIMKDIRERVLQSSSDLNNEVRRSFPNNDLISPIFDSLFGYNTDDSFDSSIF